MIFFRLCYGRNIRILPTFRMWDLIPSVMVWGGETLGSWSGHECGALMNGISTLRSKAPESSLPTVRKDRLSEPRGGSSPDTESVGGVILNFPACKQRNKCLLFLNYSVFWYFYYGRPSKDRSRITVGWSWADVFPWYLWRTRGWGVLSSTVSISVFSFGKFFTFLNFPPFQQIFMRGV